VLVLVEDQGPVPLPPEATEHNHTPVWISRSVARSFGGELTVSFGALGGRRVSLRLPAI
jgi:hypothetical protein